MLVKIYGQGPNGPERQYCPAVCMGAKKTTIFGEPDFKHV